MHLIWKTISQHFCVYLWACTCVVCILYAYVGCLYVVEDMKCPVVSFAALIPWECLLVTELSWQPTAPGTLPPPSSVALSEVPGAHSHVQSLTWALEIWTQVLVLVWQCSNPLSHSQLSTAFYHSSTASLQFSLLLQVLLQFKEQGNFSVSSAL